MPNSNTQTQAKPKGPSPPAGSSKPTTPTKRVPFAISKGGRRSRSQRRNRSKRTRRH